VSKQQFVIDCSAFMSLFLDDEQSSSMDLMLHEIHVPGHFYLECLNVLRISLLRKRITPEASTECITILRDLDFHCDRFISMPESLLLITRLSQQYSLTSYDAAYLELALRLHIPLITRDKGLRQACEAAKVELV
jgi:predicted nucleic acid-binding protein